jgi:hypothetical protein
VSPSAANPSGRRRWLAHTAALLMILVVGSASDCFDDDDEDLFDRRPPAGQGSMIIDNNTTSDIHVFINGESLPDTRDGKARAYDLNPGVYRVVLDQQGGDQTYRDDIDIIEGRNTILDVAFGPGSEYDVIIFFRH